MFDKVAYVEGRVTKEEKKAFNKDGFKVVDVRFKPDEIGVNDKVVELKPEKPKK